MKIIWLLMLMPAHADEKVTLFPGSFATKEACQQLAQVLITQRDYKCVGSEQKTILAMLGPEKTPAFVIAD